MGMLTLLELKDEVRSGLGGRTDLDSRLTRFLNLAQQRLARLHDWDEMEVISTTTITNSGGSGDRYVGMPLLREVYSIVIEDDSRSRKLVQKSPRWWDRLIPLPEYHTRDTPSMYVVWGSIVEVFQLPDKTYPLRMRWTKWPTALSADATPSEFNEKDELLVELALSYAYRSLGNPEEAQKHEAVALRLFAESDQIDRDKPDLEMVGDARQGSQVAPQDYWRDPFVRSIGE